MEVGPTGAAGCCRRMLVEKIHLGTSRDDWLPQTSPTAWRKWRIAPLRGDGEMESPAVKMERRGQPTSRDLSFMPSNVSVFLTA